MTHRAFAFGSRLSASCPYFVLLHTAEGPEAATWSQYVRALTDQLAAAKTAVHVFAVTDGGGPDAHQRRELAQAFQSDQLGSMTHVFTTSTFTRGIVTAFHWLARSRAVAHPPQTFGLVCEQCRAPLQAVLEDLKILQRGLPPVALLAEIERAARTSGSPRAPGAG